MSGSNESLAKIARPRNRNVYKRTGLFSKLDEARHSRAIWISAPPGSGKTTLISSYLHEKRCANIWYHVDENDMDVATFFWYMRLAVRELKPREYEQLPPYTSAYQGGLSAFALRYFEKMYALLPPDFVIVIDDVHLAEGNDSLHVTLMQAISALPAYGNMVIISRNPLPEELCRLRLNESLQLLEWPDLRLTAEEMRGIVTLRDPGLAEDSLKLISERADGWVAGLIFALQTVRAQPGCNTIDPDQHHAVLLGYFANEVFEQQDEEPRQLLVQMALLPRMTQAMAIKLTGNESAGTLLNWLHRHNYFVNLLTIGEPTYQLHPLFRDFLLHRLEQSYDPAELIGLQKHAASILEQNGYRGAASNLYQSAAAWGSAVRLITADASEKFRQGRIKNLAANIKSLPAGVLEESSWLRYWLGMCQMFLEPKVAHANFAVAFQRFSQEQNREGSLAAWAGAINSLMTEWEDVANIDEWIVTGEELMSSQDPAVTSTMSAHATAAMCFALFLCRPHSPALENFADKTHALLVSTKDQTFGLMGCNLMLIFYGWQGNLAKAALLLDALRPRFEGQPNSDAHQVMWEAAQSWYELISGQAEQCLVRSTQTLSLAHASGVHIFDHKLFGMAAQACLLLGRLDEARAHLERYIDAAPGQANLIQFHVHFLSGWERWQSGDTNEAREYLDLAAQFLKTAGSTPIIIAKLNLAMAKLHIDSGEDAEGRVCIDTATRITNITGSKWLQFNCCLLEADVAHHAGRTKECLYHLQAALETARLNNLVVTDWWHAPTMSLLLEIALANEIEPDYAKHIIKTMDLRPGPLSATSAAWPWPVSVELLGHFELKVAGSSVGEKILGQRKVLELLKVLVVYGSAGTSQVRLAEAIWPDAEGDDARNALKTTVHRLRKVLGMNAAVQIKEGLMSLHSGYCWSDTEAFRALAKTPRSSAKRTRNLQKALKLYRGILLPDDDMPWIIEPRKKLQHIEHEIVMEQGSHYEEHCRWDKAIRVFRQGLDSDSLDEQVCRHLMKCYQSTGRAADALAAYEEYCDQLARHAARRPSPKIRSLAESMLHS